MGISVKEMKKKRDGDHNLNGGEVAVFTVQEGGVTGYVPTVLAPTYTAHGPCCYCTAIEHTRIQDDDPERQRIASFKVRSLFILIADSPEYPPVNSRALKFSKK